MQSAKQKLFQWDEGNSTKSWIKHRISKQQTEQCFYNPRAKIFSDIKHSSDSEARYLLYSETTAGKKLCIAFTKRGQKIRPISSRLMNKKEREIYEKTIKNT